MNQQTAHSNKWQGQTKWMKSWILACRPETKTLSVCMVPVLVSTALVFRNTKTIHWGALFSILLCVSFVQMGMNLIGDALDDLKGDKPENKLGELRAVLFPVQQILMGGYICLFFAAFFGIPLMLLGGWPYVFLIMTAISCAYLYTGGPFPFGYLGVSEILLLVFYGWVAVFSTYYIQTETWNNSVWLAGTQMGFLAIVPLAINNLRDHVADRMIDKKTLAVRFGIAFARYEIAFCSIFPYLFGFIWLSEESGWMAFLPLLTLVPTIRNLMRIWNQEPSREFTKYIAMSAKIQLLFGILLIIGSFFE